MRKSFATKRSRSPIVQSRRSQLCDDKTEIGLRHIKGAAAPTSGNHRRRYSSSSRSPPSHRRRSGSPPSDARSPPINTTRSKSSRSSQRNYRNSPSNPERLQSPSSNRHRSPPNDIQGQPNNPGRYRSRSSDIRSPPSNRRISRSPPSTRLISRSPPSHTQVSQSNPGRYRCPPSDIRSPPSNRRISRSPPSNRLRSRSPPSPTQASPSNPGTSRSSHRTRRSPESVRKQHLSPRILSDHFRSPPNFFQLPNVSKPPPPSYFRNPPGNKTPTFHGSPPRFLPSASKSQKRRSRDRTKATASTSGGRDSLQPDYVYQADGLLVNPHLRSQKPLCRHWLLSNCRNGDQCNFLHERDETKLPECMFEQNSGRCTKPNCPFKHSGGQMNAQNKRGDVHTNDTPLCRHWLLDSCTKGRQCPFLHERIESKLPDCHFEQKSGKCTSRTCPFKHHSKPKSLQSRRLDSASSFGGRNRGLYGLSQSARTSGRDSQPLHRQHSAPIMPTSPPPRASAVVVATLPTGSDAPDICTFHLTSKCSFNDKCKLFHATLPYQWQYERNGDWVTFDYKNNKLIEEEFCQAEQNSLTLSRSKVLDQCLKLSFGSMQYTSDVVGQIRRLSTRSWGCKDKSGPFATEWLWYWLDEHNTWRLYEEPQKIEEAFQDGVSAYNFTIDENEFNYKINFKQMKQKNTKTKTKRNVRRRPRLHAKPAAHSSVSRSHYPDTWHVTSQSKPELITVTSSSAEYRDVARRFHATMRGSTIKSIKRVQNKELWAEFDLMKQKMLRKRSASVTTSDASTSSDPIKLCAPLNERLLFHGTKKHVVETIYSRRGFDWRMAGSSTGTVYGKGNYFARDAKYSKDYSNSNILFVVRVLVGDVAAGRSDYLKPPPKNARKPLEETYDTCVNNVTDPSIFVTFEFGQSYPAYIIEY